MSASSSRSDRGGEAALPGADDRLLGRLRQLSLVELDALVAGASPERRAELCEAYAGDLADALGRARARMSELVATISKGPDPLALVGAPAATRAKSGATEASGRLAVRLDERAEACRDLARLDEACALLLPRLIEVDRRR